MSKSLLEQLPEIVRAGKREAERILEGLEGRTRIGLQTRELVTPAKDSNWQEFQSLRTTGKAKTTIGGEFSLVNDVSGQSQLVASQRQWFNRLIYGDNLLAMSALLAGDESTPSLRGKIDLIYIDPPFDSKADYRTKITLPGGDVEQKPTVIEQFAYSDTWAEGTASYLAMIVPRLCLMRELLSAKGSIYVHLDWHVAHFAKLCLDEIFGNDRLINEVIWKRQTAKGGAYPQIFGRYGKMQHWVLPSALGAAIIRDGQCLSVPNLAKSMNAPHFDTKKVHSLPFGRVAWMDEVMAEEKRCCGQIDAPSFAPQQNPSPK